MPQLPAQLSNFSGPFAGINGQRDLSPSLSDLVRAAVTTGYPNLAASTMPATFHRSCAVLFRASLVLAFLDAPRGDRIARSDDYDRADRSEKVAISYYLGLFGAKLGAELLLRTPWLLHYDAYHRLAQGVGPIARRPDLIGRSTTGEWIAIEAKGRTNGLTDTMRTSAKTQARTLDRIVHPGGATEPIEANVASITFFDRGGWCLSMDDPPAEPQPLRLTASLDEMYSAYYEPVLAYVGAALEQGQAESVEIGDVAFKVAYDPDLDLFIGAANAIIETRSTDLEALPSALTAVLGASDGSSRRRSPQVEDEEGRRGPWARTV